MGEPFGQWRLIVTPRMAAYRISTMHSFWYSVTTTMPWEVIKGTRCTSAISLLEKHPWAICQVALPLLRVVNGHSIFTLTYFNYSWVLKYARSIMLVQGTSDWWGKGNKVLHGESWLSYQTISIQWLFYGGTCSNGTGCSPSTSVFPVSMFPP